MKDFVQELAFAAVARRAMLLEQWLVKHAEHYPGPSIAHDLYGGFISGKCSCLAAIEISLTFDVVWRET